MATKKAVTLYQVASVLTDSLNIIWSIVEMILIFFTSVKHVHLYKMVTAPFRVLLLLLPTQYIYLVWIKEIADFGSPQVSIVLLLHLWFKFLTCQPSVKEFAHVSRDNIKTRHGMDIIFSWNISLTPFP